MSDDQSYKDLASKYNAMLDKGLGHKQGYSEGVDVTTDDYETFKKENMPPPLTWYEKACQQSEKLLKIKPSADKAERIRKAIDTAHLNITPTGAASLAILVPMLLIVMFGLLSYVLLQSMFLLTFFTFAGLAIMAPLNKMPFFIETKWRMDASREMVLSVFYVVTYMRHTSNLEKGIQFASDHLTSSLALDFKRLLWNVQTEKFSTIKESLDDYLEQWRVTNMEFVEAFHLLEGSLYEGSEDRRLALLDKSLDVVLDGTYEKMLHFAQNLKAPINTLNMLGVILPILGLVILPLVVSFMDNVRWYHISVLYNLGLPLAVYLLGKSILLTRPTGYGQSSVSQPKKAPKRMNIAGVELGLDAMSIAVILAVFLLTIGFSPLIIHLLNPDYDISLTSDMAIKMNNDPNAPYKFLDYQPSDSGDGTVVGPFGLGASLLSILVPLGIGLPIGLYYRMKSQNVIKIREQTKKLELEFSSALFQLGNRLSDGYPAEIVFDKIADVMSGSVSGQFFSAVGINIRKLGMSVDDAIFNPASGALKDYPSSLIESSMKVLTQSIRKGPTIAAAAMSNVARYVKEIHRVNERLNDLMSEIISSMQGQIKFLTPAISGIVVGITAMITGILGKLGSQMKNMSSMGNGGGLMDMFGQGLPTFYFQMIVGIYVVQLAYILTDIIVGIESGEDKQGKEYALGQNLVRTTVLYCVISFAVILIFTLIAGSILDATLIGE